MRLLQRDVCLIGEVEVVPRNLVAEDRRSLERAHAFRGDHLVVLVNVVQARLEHRVGTPLFPQAHEQLENVLAVLREGADVEVVHDQVLRSDPELGGRLANLTGERVRRKAFGKGARRDGEGHIAHFGTVLDEARHRAAGAELPVVGVRGEHEHALPGADHAAFPITQP